MNKSVGINGMNKDRAVTKGPIGSYLALGIILITSGLAVSAYSYVVIESVPLTAVGLTAFITGITAALISGAGYRPSSNTSAVLLGPFGDNFATMLEHLGIDARCIYLPQSEVASAPRAVIPISGIDGVRLRGSTVYGGNPAIAVKTPGEVALRYVKVPPAGSERALRQLMYYLIVDTLELAQRLDASVGNAAVHVEIGGAKRAGAEAPYSRWLGSPIASIAAAASARILDKPIRIVKEVLDDEGTGTIELEILA